MFKLEKYFFVKQEEAANGDQAGSGGGDAGTSLINDGGDTGASESGSGESGESDGESGQGGEAQTTETSGEEQGGDDKQNDRPEWLLEGYDTPEAMSEALKGIKETGVLGAPESDYEVKLPEGAEDFKFFESEVGSISQFKELAKGMNLSDKAFNQLVGFYVDSKIHEGGIHLQSVQEASAALVGGADRIQTISAKAKAQMSPEDFALFTKAASTAPDAPGAAIKLIEKLVLKGETAPMGDSGAGAFTGKSESELTEMMKDPRYKTDKNYRKEVMDGFKLLYPDQ